MSATTMWQTVMHQYLAKLLPNPVEGKVKTSLPPRRAFRAALCSSSSAEMASRSTKSALMNDSIHARRFSPVFLFLLKGDLQKSLPPSVTTKNGADSL